MSDKALKSRTLNDIRDYVLDSIKTEFMASVRLYFSPIKAVFTLSADEVRKAKLNLEEQEKALESRHPNMR